MSIYSRDFSSRFGDEIESVIAEFVNKITESGLTAMQIKTGIGVFKKRAAAEPWSVNPAEFVIMCRPTSEQLGLPAPEKAYRECCTHGRWATEHDWSHGAVYAAGRETGWYDLHNKPENHIWALFKRNYEIMCNRVANGESFDEVIPKALPEKISNPVPATKAISIIDQLRKKHGLRS